MHPDLAALVDLQRLDSAIEAARKTLADIPQRETLIETTLAEAAARLEAAKRGVVENRSARGAVEKDMAVIQQRLDRFKDQTMAVKTNKEFHALQHEIATAQEEIRRFEDRILEFMVQADELTAAVKAAEADLAGARRAATEQRARLQADMAGAERELATRLTERDTTAANVPRQALMLFESVRRGRGVAVSPMRDGRCSICQVRLRPQVAQIVRRNDTIVQCESCSRILYHEPPAGAQTPAADPPPADAPRG
jgi:hypothetical protein